MAKKNEYLVIGFKRVDYTKKSGGEVHGTEIYLTPVESDEGVVGTQAESCYISDRYALYKPQINDTVRKLYNQYGGVEDLAVI